MDTYIPSDIVVRISSFLENKLNILLTSRPWYRAINDNDISILNGLIRLYSHICDICIHDMVMEAIESDNIEIIESIIYEYSSYLPVRWSASIPLIQSGEMLLLLDVKLKEYQPDMILLSKVYDVVPMSLRNRNISCNPDNIDMFILCESTDNIIKYIDSLDSIYIGVLVYIGIYRRYDVIRRMAQEDGFISSMLWDILPRVDRKFLIDNNYVIRSSIAKASFTDDLSMINNIDIDIDCIDMKEIAMNDAFSIYSIYKEEFIQCLRQIANVVHGDILVDILSDIRLGYIYLSYISHGLHGTIDRSHTLRLLIDNNINRHIIIAVAIVLEYIEIVDLYMGISDMINVYSLLNNALSPAIVEVLQGKGLYPVLFNAFLGERYRGPISRDFWYPILVVSARRNNRELVNGILKRMERLLRRKGQYNDVLNEVNHILGSI